GALSSAFIPVFAGYLAKEREKEAWHVASSVMNVLILSLVALSALMWLAAPWIVPAIVAPGCRNDPAQRQLTIHLSRIMLLSPIFMGLSALVTGVLQSYRQFLAGAGAAMMFLVQIPGLTFRRTRYALSLDLDHKGVREVFLLAGPRTLSLAAVQLVFFVDTYLASFMPTGYLTALN